MARTYLTQLVNLVRVLCKYSTKYSTQISAALPSPEKELWLALVASCNAFMNSDIPEIAKND